MKTLFTAALGLWLAANTAAAQRLPSALERIESSDLQQLADILSSEVSALDEDFRPNRRSFEARLEAIRRNIARLAGQPNSDALRAEIVQRIDEITRGLATPTTSRQDEFGVRIEEDLGEPVRHPSDRTGDDTQWLVTAATQFVNIQKSVFLGKAPQRNLEIVNGIQMNGSFVAERANTQVGIVFSAETQVSAPGKRMFVRALIDGVPAAPSDVVFASGTHRGLRSFIFTTSVDPGIHTVEIQWRVDEHTVGFMRTAGLLIRTGRSVESALGSLAVVTPSSGPNLQLNQPVWQNVPSASGWIYVPNNGVLTASFSAEAFASEGRALALRALVDNVVAQPSDVVFARNSAPQSRSMTFGVNGLAAGWHSVRVQWLAEAGGTATMGDRSLMLAAYPSPTAQPSHPFVAAPSGPNVSTLVQGFQPIPNLSTLVTIPAKGNGEVAVQFSGEISADVPAFAALAIDDVVQVGSTVELTDGLVPSQVKSFVFAAKHLPAGQHKVEVWWAPTPMTQAHMGDRTMAVMSETGFIPDLAEQRVLGSGKRDVGDNLHGLEPMIGKRDVLLILWDPLRPGHPLGVNTPPNPDFILPPGFTGVITRDQVEQLFFGAADSANDYYRAVSGGKFGIRKAGVVGWLGASKLGNHYFGAHPTCGEDDGDSFESGNRERWAEALAGADAFVDFKHFDKNSDGVVSPVELAIVIVSPQSTSFGTAHQWVFAAECPNNVPVELDGVRVPEILEVFINFTDPVDAINVAAHELLHQLTGQDDMYDPVPAATRAARLSIMDARQCLPHLDPVHKLAFGWVTPKPVTSSGFYEIDDVKVGRTVRILPRSDSGALPEYFILENRQDSAQASPYYDTNIDDSGIAVWHVVENPIENAHVPRGVSQAFWDGVPQTQARRGIRLLRPWQFVTEDGAVILDDSDLWSSAEYTLASAPCPALFLPPGVLVPSHNTLSWADCSASGYEVRFLDLPAPSMTINVQLK